MELNDTTMGIILILIAIFVFVILRTKKKIDLNKIYPSGYSINSAVEYLEKNSHCGLYWNCKAKYNKEKNLVEIYMQGNEYRSLDLITGKITYEDLD